MKENNEIKENIITTTVEDVLHTSMIPYAESVILDRALPRVEDGLKPVQRRILYAMYDLGLTPDKPYKKSAKVVGECLAKYHPHGDSSVYDAMVKLAQPFSMGSTLVDGQGNFGTIDGDGAAAMRYTEARLNSLALEMLRDLEKDTVEWQNNYDDSLKEPVTLPSRIPNILINGAMGIAVGLATNIPTHNLAECLDACIAIIRNPKIKLSDIMQIMPGPDFPTGGMIVNKDDIIPAYETGNGKILVRASSNIEVDSQGKQSIIITEIPYRVNKGSLLEKIGELIDSKEGAYGQVSEAVDESDRQGMRIVIKIRKGGDASSVWKSLLKDTQLQTTFGINMVVIAEGKPQQLGIIDILKHYTNYQKQVVLNRTKYDLNKAKLRLEIVEGLIIAVTNIDKVIAIIKKSPDTPTAKQNLRKEFNLSDVQAQAILDLKLARITRLEVQNLKDELTQLKETIKYLQSIIDSKAKLNEVIIDEMTLIKKQFKSPRRTRIEKNDKINLNSYNEGELAGAQEEVENIVIGYTGDGKIKKVPLMSFSRSKKVNPLPEELFTVKCDAKSNQYVLAFTDYGNAFKIRPKYIDGSKGMNSKGVQINAICQEVNANEKIVFMYPMTAGEEGNAEGKLIIYTERGMVKLSELKELFVSKDCYQVIKLKEDDKVVSAELFDENKDMFFASERGMCLLADKSEVPVQGRVAGGVKGMDVDDNDKVIFAGQVSQLDEYVAVTTSFGTFKKVELKTINRIARARKGVMLVDLGKKENNEIVISCQNFKYDDKSLVAVLDRLGIMYYIELDDIVIDSRTTKGKMVSKIGECQPNVVYFARR